MGGVLQNGDRKSSSSSSSVIIICILGLGLNHVTHFHHQVSRILVICYPLRFKQLGFMCGVGDVRDIT